MDAFVISLTGSSELARTEGVSLLHDLYDVLIVQRVLEPDALRLMLRARAPHARVLELVDQVLVHAAADVVHGGAAAEDDGLDEVRPLPAPLGVDAHEVEVLPHPRQQQVDVQLLRARSLLSDAAQSVVVAGRCVSPSGWR